MNSLLDHLNIGDFVSIASLLITIIVFYNVRKIRAYYSFTARIPALIDRLAGHTAKLAGYLKDFQNSSQPIEVELARSEATLELLKKMVDHDTKRSIEQVLTQIGRFRQTRPTSRYQLGKIHADMSKLADQVKDLQEERKWER
jgi:hypothetical protein